MVATVDFDSNTCTIDVPASPNRDNDPVTVNIDETGAEAQLVFKEGAESTTFNFQPNESEERVFLKVGDRFVVEKPSGDSFILVLAPKGSCPERAFLAFAQITE